MPLAMLHNGHIGWNFANLNTNPGFALFWLHPVRFPQLAKKKKKKRGYSYKPLWLVETKSQVKGVKVSNYLPGS